MPYISEKDESKIGVIIDIIIKINGYVVELSDFNAFKIEYKTIDAVLMNLIVIGELSSKISLSQI